VKTKKDESPVRPHPEVGWFFEEILEPFRETHNDPHQVSNASFKHREYLRLRVERIPTSGAEFWGE
jgi:hypothetical protein